MEMNELVQIIESLLFVSQEPLLIDKIKEVTGADKKTIRETLETLKGHFMSEDHGIKVVEIAGGFQMVTRPENAPWVKKLLTVKTTGKLSKPGLETLAIVAYKQPIIRPEIESIRGVDCGGVIKTLLERRLIKIVGRKEMPGKPMLYGTTREFLEYFGLNAISELPTLKEFKDDSFSPPEPEFIQEKVLQVPHGTIRPEPENAKNEAHASQNDTHTPEIEVVFTDGN
ncbi:MAG: SMC-Scp complex subunit ScpB [Nitrospiria bacterium]